MKVSVNFLTAKIAICFAMMVGVLPSASSQTNPAKSYDNDVVSVQSVLDAYYDCISGPIGQVRDFDRLKNLFHPSGRLVYSHWNEDSSKASTLIFNIDEFIDQMGYLDKKGFYEHEVSNVIHTFSSVTQVFSTYKFRAEDNSIPQGQGITSYEIFFDGNRYWILSMLWSAENDKYKIPSRYLGE